MSARARHEELFETYLADLAGVRWRVDGARRVTLGAGQRHRLCTGTVSMVYVHSGELRQPGSGGGGSGTVVGAGDIMIHTGTRPCELEAATAAAALAAADGPAGAIVVALRSDRALPGFAGLPTPVVIHDFAEREPVISQLALSMGCAGNVERAGDSVVCSQIATTVMSAAMRSWLEHGCAPAGWLTQFSDASVAEAIRAIHDQPGRQWTVGDLAQVAAMSRSVFADRFRAVIGSSPAAYVADVRMTEATTRLGRSAVTVAALAHDLGYGSEEGFRRAFRRHTGTTPALWRRTQTEQEVAS
ncbi:AraC family transcriptional regulator [Nocardioides sp.]|uniref:helix-turn-helix domain-containing protein n=1 Tax=Nocardioides sp. TaxID=35761 RepID=UPI00260FB3A5|nr:AraC family transcriptional regulator [Nocardioides sp.]